MQCKARLNLITGHERVVASTRKKDPSSARATYYLAASRILPTRFSRVTGYCCKRQWPSDACNRFWASLDHRCRQSAPALFFLFRTRPNVSRQNVSARCTFESEIVDSRFFFFFNSREFYSYKVFAVLLKRVLIYSICNIWSACSIISLILYPFIVSRDR